MKASKNPVKGLYGSAMLIGAVIGLGCGAGKAFSKDATTGPSPKPHLRPYIGPYVALQNLRERQELLKIYDEMLGELRQRVMVKEAKNDFHSQGSDPESHPLSKATVASTPKEVASDSDDIAPTLVIGANAVRRAGTVEAVSSPSIETPAYPGQSRPAASQPNGARPGSISDAAPAAPARWSLGARFAKNESFRGLKPVWKRRRQP